MHIYQRGTHITCAHLLQKQLGCEAPGCRSLVQPSPFPQHSAVLHVLLALGYWGCTTLQVMRPFVLIIRSTMHQPFIRCPFSYAELWHFFPKTLPPRTVNPWMPTISPLLPLSQALASYTVISIIKEFSSIIHLPSSPTTMCSVCHLLLHLAYLMLFRAGTTFFFPSCLSNPCEFFPLRCISVRNTEDRVYLGLQRCISKATSFTKTLHMHQASV